MALSWVFNPGAMSSEEGVIAFNIPGQDSSNRNCGQREKLPQSRCQLKRLPQKGPMEVLLAPQCSVDLYSKLGKKSKQHMKEGNILIQVKKYTYSLALKQVV